MVFKKNTKPVVKSYTSNPGLVTIKPGWAGSPLDQNGLLIYEESPTMLSFRDVLKYMLQRNPQRQEKNADRWRIVVRTDEDRLNDLADKIVWLGDFFCIKVTLPFINTVYAVEPRKI
ncbi:MAG: hypothetical protein J0I32_12150 [Sphingobacteriales bacterium]|nr:hypothetical protein [Sphingobacteriales bacterium]OJW00974.1 MAG: hypothetical protein BGO52_05925 [Sphingobacteriales bacterium 44-61]